MARGSYRPGSGRKKASGPGIDKIMCDLSRLSPSDVPANPNQEPSTMPYNYPTALDFAMAVINDEKVPMADRIRLAVAVLPFQQGKFADIPAKMAAKAKAAALTATPATEADAEKGWGDDLAFRKAN